MTDTVTVNASALRQVLTALVGHDYEIRELMIADSFNAKLGREAPVTTLINQYNEQIRHEQS